MVDYSAMEMQPLGGGDMQGGLFSILKKLLGGSPYLEGGNPVSVRSKAYVVPSHTHYGKQRAGWAVDSAMRHKPYEYPVWNRDKNDHTHPWGEDRTKDSRMADSTVKAARSAARKKGKGMDGGLFGLLKKILGGSRTELTKPSDIMAFAASLPPSHHQNLIQEMAKQGNGMNGGFFGLLKGLLGNSIHLHGEGMDGGLFGLLKSILGGNAYQGMGGGLFGLLKSILGGSHAGYGTHDDYAELGGGAYGQADGTMGGVGFFDFFKKAWKKIKSVFNKPAVKRYVTPLLQKGVKFVKPHIQRGIDKGIGKLPTAFQDLARQGVGRIGSKVREGVSQLGIGYHGAGEFEPNNTPYDRENPWGDNLTRYQLNSREVLDKLKAKINRRKRTRGGSPNWGVLGSKRRRVGGGPGPSMQSLVYPLRRMPGGYGMGGGGLVQEF